MHDFLYGLDIGGTKIGMAIGNAAGEILAADRLPTRADARPETLLDECLERFAGLAASIGAAAAPAAIGAACPGPISSREGRFLDPPNMPRWHGFELVAYLRSRLGCPVGMMNDADASVLAEHLWGAARGVRHAVYLTMSTGMGAGLLLDGRVYEGASNLAGEIGHLRLSDDGPVGFGKRGSVEGYLSGGGIVQVARGEALACEQTGTPTALTDALRDGGDLVERICAAAIAGDTAAKRVIDRCATQLGQLMAILTDVLNPELFVLGTIGVAHPDLFIPRASEVLKTEAIPHSAKIVRIVPSTLPDRGNQSAVAVARRVILGD